MKKTSEYIEELLSIPNGDWQNYHATYDSLLWSLAVSPVAELKEIISDILDGPYKQLPVPMQVLIARIVALKSVCDKEREMFEQAKFVLSLYNDSSGDLDNIVSNWNE